ncbi:MAG: alpha/beta hydrolase [Balneolaceae bacterium]|nr:alpha/beta hydrolase [Balneolaceae bacterium]MBO6547195.1 alpha/beta hydrolase [Balneolaceae bacterium]MBO6647858.1 alpha/beta hydrolase [Balneolaceae bacterium]
MKYFLRILKWLIALALLGFIGIIIFIQTVDFSVSEEQIGAAFDGLQYSPEFRAFNHEGREMHYVAVGDTSKQTVLFVHGSPGSWDNFLYFLADSIALKKYRLIAVDRPGFGKSGNGVPERSLQQQAEIINEVLVREQTSAILVGHSYGGPVITRMAIDFPGYTDGLVLVAGSVDPELEKTKWYQIPVHYKILSWILPDLLYSTNEEILALKNELEEMEPDWKQITQPVSVIQGGKDMLVPKENADFAQKMLVNAPVKMVVIPEMNHFVPWNRSDLIRQEIDRLARLLNPEN